MVGLDDEVSAKRLADADIVKSLRREIRQTAEPTLRKWFGQIADDVGGFHGKIDAAGQPAPDAPRSAVLYTQLLWAFSALSEHLKSAEALALAHRAAAHLHGHFIDPDHGGLYFQLNARGQVTDARKHAYVQASGVQAFAEYARITGNVDSLRTARDLQRELEERFWDLQRGGYVAAMSAFWHTPADPRLLESDPDCPRTATAHLRIVEAYGHLHRVAPTDMSQAALHRALGLYIDRFVDVASGHLCLFYNQDWTGEAQGINYGQDIAASWRLWKAVSTLGDREMQARVRALSLSLAAAARDEGRTPDGCLRAAGYAQVEALIGFVTAGQISGNPAYLDAASKLWPHVKAGLSQDPCAAARILVELDRR
ncbi:MAG TPA: AGE family epimerase/isomerase [Asticcacaulis sp.]|nr:AGE family epimerase/isomerase [Asticcacaulis sp.]